MLLFAAGVVTGVVLVLFLLIVVVVLVELSVCGPDDREDDAHLGPNYFVEAAFLPKTVRSDVPGGCTE